MAFGWGTEGWGSSPWGGKTPPDIQPPSIIPIDPRIDQVAVAQTKPLCISLADNVSVNLATLQLSVSGVNWIIGGVAVNGATLLSLANSQNGFDILVSPPAAYPLGSRQSVFVRVADTAGTFTDLLYHFRVGVGPRLLTVRNPVPNLLLAHFNRPMSLDDAFRFVPNWVVEPVSEGAVPLIITDVSSTTTQPDVALLRYTGGGSEYELSVLSSVVSQESDPLERGFNSVVFDILFPEEDVGTVRLFDSVFGPLGISQRIATRRSMDEHTADRSLALALDEQFRLRFQQLDDTVGRDGKPGKSRTT